jgi:hypothetical protein
MDRIVNIARCGSGQEGRVSERLSRQLFSGKPGGVRQLLSRSDGISIKFGLSLLGNVLYTTSYNDIMSR